ncbi:uncharacterized protein LOC112561621 [Pomacea canaliculata]|uniref:uncharacterized protein LOC112561621 n=1 Tax=Pomacea canaliculata TaxID=400727 RepID=UPI000D72BCD5|nr:uncharacterized protein LOC112561621 [Pomacea canaliculata]
MRCKGSNLTLNEPDLGVTVLHVFVSRGGESLASSSVPATGQFQDRLIVEDDGRVTLSSLTPDDLGKYRVEIQQPEDRHIQRSLRLVISEPPETIDGTLAVNKLLSPTNNSVRLTCGNFTSLGFPRVSVLWKDTRGNILPSDGFEDRSSTWIYL